MTIALIGGYGQLGTALSRTLVSRSVSLSRTECDLLNFNSASAKLDSLSPELVINCAAYNFVDAAEDDLQSAHRLNAVAPGQLAEYCTVRDIPLVHISSDYVFGRKNATDRKPFAEGVEPVPDSVYGQPS